MWENVDIIFKNIESRTDFIYHTTDLYDSQYCSKEYEGCSLQSSNFIRELVQLKKPLGVRYGIKSHCISINERFSMFQGCHQYRRKKQKIIFPPFGNNFLYSIKIYHIEKSANYLSVETKDLCEYNPICLLSGVKIGSCQVKQSIQNSSNSRY